MRERRYKTGRSSAATRIRRKRNPPSMEMAVAGPSGVNHQAHSAEELDEGVAKEMALVERLISGHGLSDGQWEGLFTICEKCSQHFVRSKLSGHGKVCNGLIVL